MANISLTEEKETLFITLRAKAQDSRREHSILHDSMAYEILLAVNYDFDKYAKSMMTL
jgi:O-methyltransferase involved in polyketide biosynthesis